ncbi:Glutamate mutase subunit E /glutamate mutase subunit S [Sporobacter termitidis DSM 10068]|uniref:Glutamate mutase subunit E /glutamate mutase subunit S n=1 Tax=Sporobacter termitidis DSM 10068 TaxID=1123282 RepID=A0A1M5ZBX3_9FIRM|nr:methylaspartate mutase subunit S [Sporobacter termitidis]SHI21692.1 Glutamate mutase subunit E /glutamate mutase subunit S [Sporobacter termitidis DSM 10068]
MIRVKQQKIEDRTFAKMRAEQLAQWPTGREVDIDEAVEYHKKMPDSKNFTKALAKYKAEGKIGLFPRSGVPVVEDEIKLLQGLNAVGVRLFPFTTDSYTRNLQLDKAQRGLEESIRTGKNKINGYPIINHGVKTTRRVVESCEGAFDPRSSRVANSFVGEIAFASGMTAMPNSFFGWIGGYDKKATPEECIETAQYLGRLIGLYAEKGVIISTDTHGWLPNGVIPMYVNIATQIIEALISAGQGTKSIVPLMNFQGNIAQDVAEIRICEKLFRKYLDKFGFTDTIIPGVIGNQSSLFPFPQDLGNAFGYINFVAMEAAMTDLAACSVKTIDEALGVPSIESHMQTYASAGWIFNVVRQQKFMADTPAIAQEMRMTELAVSAILDKVLEMGEGDVAVGVVKAIEAGVLDSPFSINIYPRDLCMGARDLEGACRYIDYGNLPIPEEVRKYNDEKIREREKFEGVRLGFKGSMADFWCLSQGKIIGTFDKGGAAARDEKIEMRRVPTVVTGTCGVDAHVIGTKIISKALKEDGFNVVALGAQTPAEEFIKAAQETDADAMLITSLYGMAEMDLQGFRDKCVEAGIGDILLYIGGILGVGTRVFEEDEATFKKLGFDRVYPPESDVKQSIRDLCGDLKKRGRI